MATMADIDNGCFKLLDLPLEILEQIFDYHSDNKPLLCALKTQCRLLNRVVRRIFFKEVKLSLLNLDYSFFFNRPAECRTLFWENVALGSLDLNPILDAGAVRAEEPLGFFTTMLQKDPELGFMVRTLQLDWSFGCQETHDAANALIDKLPNLRSLKIVERISTWKLDARPSFCFPEGRRMARLDEVTLSQGVYDHNSFMYMSQVKVFTIEDTAIPTVLRIDTREGLEGTSPVTELNLGSAFLTLTQHSLRNVLKRPENLQKLRLAPPGTFGRVRTVGPSTRKHMISLLSPKALEKALVPQKHSLVKLNIFNHNIEWAGHDLSRLDLSCFKALRKLIVPSRCLFPPTDNATASRQLYPLLPQSIVQLRVRIRF
jgi:hypothetical protein